MPELPEVETVRRGITPHIRKRRIEKVIIRQRQLRWPITRGLEKKLCGKQIGKIDRRGKYLLLTVGQGTLLIHLGMSGRLQIVPAGTRPGKHDHVDIVVGQSCMLRFSDPRRFGSVLWVEGDPMEHKLLANLGPEPLADDFTGQYLHETSRRRRTPVKSLIMNSHTVVGVGNIYANEALFMAGIHPARMAASLDRDDCMRLASSIKQVLATAIVAGGTTLKDFISADGKPGYFQQSLMVYGRGGQACYTCNRMLLEDRLGQRSTVYCPFCQK